MDPLRLFCAALLMGLASCAPPKEVVIQHVPVAVQIPEPLKYCPDAPEVPENGATQRGVAAYVVELHNAYIICRLKLKAVNQIVADFEAQIDARAQR